LLSINQNRINMKKNLIIAVTLLSAALFLNFNTFRSNTKSVIPPSPEFSMPDDVKQIVDHSCVGCHSSDSRNTKAKLKLKFDELGDLNVGKLAGKLSKIEKVLEKEKMPPKKFLEKNPDKAPTAEQRALLKKWAESTANSLSE